MGIGGVDPGATVKDRNLGFGSTRPEVPLPPDATSTLFVEGLPANCTRREVARILLVAAILFFYHYLLSLSLSTSCTFLLVFSLYSRFTRYFSPFCWL